MSTFYGYVRPNGERAVTSSDERCEQLESTGWTAEEIFTSFADAKAWQRGGATVAPPDTTTVTVAPAPRASTAATADVAAATAAATVASSETLVDSAVAATPRHAAASGGSATDTPPETTFAVAFTPRAPAAAESSVVASAVAPTPRHASTARTITPAQPSIGLTAGRQASGIPFRDHTKRSGMNPHMRAHLKANATEDTFTEEDQRRSGERSQRMVVQSMHTGSGSCRALEKMVQFRRWYKNHYGKDFDATRPNDAIEDLLEEAEKALAGEGSHSAKGITNKLTLLKQALVIQGRPPSWEVEETRRATYNTAAAQAKVDRARGYFKGPVARTPGDVKHIFNVILRDSQDGIVSCVDLQTMVRLMISQKTGRRVCESHFIAATSWKMELVRDGVGLIKFRRLTFEFAWQKAKGYGKYGQRLAEGVALESDAVAMVLVYMERRGMIQSALAVWDGTEELKISSERFESTQLLVDALHNTQKRLIRALLPVAAGEHNTFLGVEPNGDFDDLPASSEVFYSTAAEERQKHGKETFFVSYTKLNLPSRRAQKYHDSHRQLRHVATSAGYKSSKHRQLGFAQDRKGAIANCLTGQSKGLSVEVHMNSHLANSAQIRHDSYILHDDWRRSVDSNLMHEGVHPDAVDDAMKGVLVASGFDDGDFFDREMFPKPLLDDLPSPREFIVKQSGFRPGPKLWCPYSSCPLAFESIGEFFEHLNTCVLSKQTAQCPCGAIFHADEKKYKWSVYKRLSQHLSKGYCDYFQEKHPLFGIRRKKREKETLPAAQKKIVCQGCGRQYAKNAALVNHQRVAKSCPLSSAYDERVDEKMRQRETKKRARLDDTGRHLWTQAKMRALRTGVARHGMNWYKIREKNHGKFRTISGEEMAAKWREMFPQWKDPVEPASAKPPPTSVTPSAVKQQKTTTAALPPLDECSSSGENSSDGTLLRKSSRSTIEPTAYKGLTNQPMVWYNPDTENIEPVPDKRGETIDLSCCKTEKRGASETIDLLDSDPDDNSFTDYL